MTVPPHGRSSRIPTMDAVAEVGRLDAPAFYSRSGGVAIELGELPDIETRADIEVELDTVPI